MFTLVIALLLAGTPPATAHPRDLERLDRGLVAVRTADGVFLSWRLLREEVTGHTSTGLDSPAFAVFRDGKRIATVTGSTNHLDPDPGDRYRVVPLGRGAPSRWVSPWDNAFWDLPLRKPPDGVTPTGEAYTYSANDVSVGDMDGDGRYEYVVKWDPSNSKDVSQVGYTGPVYLDTYQFDGTLLHRIDLGVNVRAGAHYTQFLVYDFDRDGRAELMLKTAPGSKVMTPGAVGTSRCRARTSKPATRTRTTTG
ncbi:hypothetical protein ACQPW3_18985 [Actinosynnema sp. CA-248983]